MNLNGLTSIREELRKNARLRLGMIVIGALLAIYLISGLSQWREQLVQDYAAQQDQLVRIRGISKQDGWADRAATAATIRKALQAQIPDADSVGLAQATFQGWLSDLARSAGNPLSITMGTPVEVDQQPGYWKIPAKLSGALSVRSAMELIRQVESRNELVTIDSIELTNGKSPRVSLDVATYYRVAP